MMNLIETICYTIIFILVATALSSCNTLPPQPGYCEIAFAYDMEQPLPDTMEKSRIGCACSTKDILKGETISGWSSYPLETCRRVRGFHPMQWEDPIDKFFKKEYAKRSKKK